MPRDILRLGERAGQTGYTPKNADTAAAQEAIGKLSSSQVQADLRRTRISR